MILFHTWETYYNVFMSYTCANTFSSLIKGFECILTNWNINWLSSVSVWDISITPRHKLSWIVSAKRNVYNLNNKMDKGWSVCSIFLDNCQLESNLSWINFLHANITKTNCLIEFWLKIDRSPLKIVWFSIRNHCCKAENLSIPCRENFLFYINVFSYINLLPCIIVCYAGALQSQKFKSKFYLDNNIKFFRERYFIELSHFPDDSICVFISTLGIQPSRGFR